MDTPSIQGEGYRHLTVAFLFLQNTMEKNNLRKALHYLFNGVIIHPQKN
jgi:hypothetical protein